MGLEDKTKAAGKAPPQESSKSIADHAQSLEDNVLSTASKVDGFVGSALRSGATSYTLVSTLPVFFANPFAGAAYVAIGTTVANFTTNLIWKTLGGGAALGYNIVRHPINTVSTALGYVSNIALNPLGTIKGLFSAPEKIFDFMFKAKNSNKTGRTIGSLIGGGLALNYVAPELLSSATRNIGDVGSGIWAKLKAGAGMFYSKAERAIDAVQDVAKEYYSNVGDISDIVDDAGNAVDTATYQFAN